MAVASDLPDLENRTEYQDARNSVLARRPRPARSASLTSNQNRVLVALRPDLAATCSNAVIAIEDQRFYENRGVDLRGIGRALVQDSCSSSAAQGGSTITQQFVKNALQAQADRTVFQKLREAALAYHLTRKWSKEKILTQYLNTIYFGNGAYGIESAARTYFGHQRPPRLRHAARGRCAQRARSPYEAALLAGDDRLAERLRPGRAPRGRQARGATSCCSRCSSRADLRAASTTTRRRRRRCPADDIKPPARRRDEVTPYFTTWVRQQLVDRYGARRAFEGGLRGHDDARPRPAGRGRAGRSTRPGRAAGGPTRLAGRDRQRDRRGAGDGRRARLRPAAPFNLATQGQRQPGSAFKPFILADGADAEGIAPARVWPSQQARSSTCPARTARSSSVNNYEGNYSGVADARRRA